MSTNIPILPANITGLQFSKLNDGNGARVIAAVPREPTLKIAICQFFSRRW
jgi:hypothetical protein